MGKLEVVLNREGVRSLLRSAEMEAICREQAEKMAGSSGYDVTTHVGVNRVNASVATATSESYDDNLKNNTLLRRMNND
ncbi:MAG: hypothetical protein IJ719_11740 [Clostridia bacterium]|nr:hypothetical protein [Clostridia bacterium]